MEKRTEESREAYIFIKPYLAPGNLHHRKEDAWRLQPVDKANSKRQIMNIKGSFKQNTL